MEGLQNRIDSFTKTKRVKNPNKPSSNITLKWPHPASFTANPDTLSEAGFYYNPSADDPDNVTCFMCGKQLSDWEADDDPFDIHFDKCAHKCSWANIRCGLRRDMDRHGRFVFLDKARLPTSKAMEKARLETFSAGDGWIHDKVRNHGASSKKLARAGFVFMSNYPGDDLASCPYCNVSLSGWDKDDDPMDEHRKRKDKTGHPCPFFLSSSSEPASSDSGQLAKPASKTKSASSSKHTSRTTSKSKRQHQDMVMPTKMFDGDPDGDNSDSAKSTTSAAPTKTPSRKPRAASGSTSKSSAKTPRSRSTRSLKNVVEVEEGDEPEDEPPATVKKKAVTSRAKSKSIAVASEPEDDESYVVAPPTTVKKGATGPRIKSVSKTVISEDEGEELIVAPTTTVKKKKATAVRSRSKSVARPEADDDFEEPIAAAPTTKKKAAAARSRSKSVARSEQSGVDYTPAVEDTIRKSSRTKGKEKEKRPVLSEIEADGGEEEKFAPRKSSRAKTKTTGPATAKKPAASKAKARAKIVEPEPEPEEMSNDDADDLKLHEAPKPRMVSATAFKNKGKVQKEISEDEFGPIIEQPPFAPATKAKAAKKKPLAVAASIGKGKPPSSRGKTTLAAVDPPSQTDDDDELGEYVPPPPPPPRQTSIPDVDEDVDMTPLIIPKRTLAATPSVGVVQAAVREGMERRLDSESSDAQRTAAKAKHSSQSAKPASAKVRVSIAKVQPKSQMKVVDVSSGDEEEEEVKNLVEEVEKTVEVEEVRVDLKSKTRGGSKSRLFGSNVFVGDEKSNANRETYKGNFSSSSIQPIPPTSSSQSRDDEKLTREDVEKSRQAEDDYMDTGDVSMQETDVPDTQLFERDTRMEDATLPVEVPRTPLRPGFNPAAQLSSALPDSSHRDGAGLEPDKADVDVREEPQKPPLFPPLSKMPFVPIPELTEAELDMTVEEWIRYQMEVEYDKFRRDGERELQRLRRRGEDVRKVIDGL